MGTTIKSPKVQTAFRLDAELLNRLKIAARKQRRSLNNFVENVLFSVTEMPNDTTIKAMSETSKKKRKSNEIFDNVDDLMQALK